MKWDPSLFSGIRCPRQTTIVSLNAGLLLEKGSLPVKGKRAWQCLKGCASPAMVFETISALDSHSGPRSAEVTQHLAMVPHIASSYCAAGKQNYRRAVNILPVEANWLFSERNTKLMLSVTLL